MIYHINKMEGKNHMIIPIDGGQGERGEEQEDEEEEEDFHLMAIEKFIRVCISAKGKFELCPCTVAEV